MDRPQDEELFGRLAAIVGARHLLTEEADLAPWLTDWRGRVTGRAAVLVSPGSVAEVAAVVRAAAERRRALVPQGGNTSMVAGAIPDGSGEAILLSLRRLDSVGAVDRDDAAITVGAGVPLARVHAAAAEAALRFPLSLAAKGSATVGGILSTNAGGTQVLRFGPARQLVLGLEAVLPDGSLFEGLSPLRKDNRGYDLKQLLVGAEGTLGVITAATLRLVPASGRVVAWVGTRGPAQALILLRALEAATGGLVESFELVPAVALTLVLRTLPEHQPPLASPAPWNVLIEVAAPFGEDEIRALVERELAAAIERGTVADAVIARSEQQAERLWALREGVPEAERKDGVAVKHDVAVPVSRMPAFIADARAAVEARFVGARVIAFGHLGDGNVHFNVRPPAGVDRAGWIDQHGPAVSRYVHDLVLARGGTLSAEHGIGQLKLDEFARTGGAARLAALRAIKAALDPLGIMNPGKLVPLAPADNGP